MRKVTASGRAVNRSVSMRIRPLRWVMRVGLDGAGPGADADADERTGVRDCWTVVHHHCWRSQRLRAKVEVFQIRDDAAAMAQRRRGS